MGVKYLTSSRVKSINVEEPFTPKIDRVRRGFVNVSSYEFVDR